MDIQLNIYAIVLLFAFVQGVIYIFLFLKRGREEERKSDFWMAAALAALCISNLSSMLGFMGIYILGRELWFFPYSTGLIIGPIIYYYLKSQINTDFQFSKADYKHFVPYFIYFIYHLTVFLMGKNIENWWTETVHNRLYLNDITYILEIISLCVYMTLAIRLYRKYLLWLPKERSDTEGVRFDWYKHFLWAVVVGVVTALLFFIIGFWVELSYWDDWIQRAIVAVIIYYISFAGYVQAQPRHLVFNENTVKIPKMDKNSLEPFISPIENEPKEIVKTENKMDNLELEKWQSKIEKAMATEKLYLNPELTLSELSEKLESHNSLISNVINTQFQKNFNDFVNEYRVTLFKEKIKDPKLQHLTLLAIAFDCGFNSKSTFNRAVKKVTGEMPSAFLLTKTQND
jgi:AraC-like DNA-binding protein